ncbi:MAG: HD domain-containing protein [Muribaculaceae bacterium]|nr:HD domain-containing protein [Muribaculaceae bacterium]MDE6754705.1 HD domain-containing protein [Muribaculaceae bacterium]
MPLTDHHIECNKKRIIDLLQSTGREGMDKVLEYLETSGFYTAPSSINRHHNWKGGLAQHCLRVFEIASLKPEGLSRESLIICGILHDICKARMLYYNREGRVMRNHIHIKGHGYRSIKLLEKYGLKLTEEERLTIRWHMGGYNAKLEEYNEVKRARSLQLWQKIHYADRKNATRNN